MVTERISSDQWHQDERIWWDRYGEYMTYQWQLTPALHDAIREPLNQEYVNYLLKPHGKLLDIGCGSGWLSFHFAQRGMSVLGLDISAEQVNAANRRRIECHIDNVEFQCADFVDWESSSLEQQFDSVFVSAFLHHLPQAELEETIRKIAMVVKPGGRVFLYEPLTTHGPRTLYIKVIDRLCAVAYWLQLDRIPTWLNWISDRHLSELARGYTMASPHERPVDVGLLTTLCARYFTIDEIRGWHLHSMGFAMQVTALKESARRFFEPLGALWFRLDQLLFRCFGWKAFSLPGRFILCSVKLTRNELRGCVE